MTEYNQEAVTQFAESLRRRESGRVTQNLMSSTLMPDRAVQAAQIGSEINMPPAFVMRDFENAQRRAETQRLNQYLESSPGLRSWLEEDQMNRHFAAGDIEHLSNIESAFNTLARGVLSTRSGFAAAGAAMAEVDVNQIGMTQDEILQEMFASNYGDTDVAFDDLPDWMQAQMVTAAAERVQQLATFEDENPDVAAMLRLEDAAEMYSRAFDLSDRMADFPMGEIAAGFRDNQLASASNDVGGLLNALVENPVGGIAFLTQTAGESLPAMTAGTLATLITRNPAAGFSVMGGASGVREMGGEVVQFLTEQGIDISTPEAALDALQSSEDLFAEAQRRGITRGVIVGFMDAISGGLAGQQLISNAGGEIILQAMVQGLAGATGEGLAQYALGDELDWREIGIEALAELIGTPVEVFGVGGRAFLNRNRPQPSAADLARMRNTGRAANVISRISRAVTPSSTRERDPEAFQNFVDRAGLEGTSFYVAAEDVRSYNQEAGVSLATLGLTEDAVVRAESADGFVEISAGTVAARIAGTEHAAWLGQHATLDPLNEMSVAERAREGALIQQEAQAEAERMRETGEVLRSTEQQLFETVQQQLRAAGRSADVAQSEATFFTAFFRTMGQRYGADPLELYQRFGVRFQGPQSSAAVATRNSGPAADEPTPRPGTVRVYQGANGAWTTSRRQAESYALGEGVRYVDVAEADPLLEAAALDDFQSPTEVQIPEEVAAQAQVLPTTLEQSALPDGWQDVEIEIDLDGDVVMATAEDVLANISDRTRDIMAVMRCING